VSLLALAPTVLDAMGFDASELDFQLSSLMPLLHGGEPADAGFVYSEVDYDRVPRPELWQSIGSSNLRSLVRGSYKLIHDRATDRYALYDVESDPGETHDLAAQEPDLVRSMRLDLDLASERALAGALQGDARRSLSEDQRATLRELGYVED
jgi:arylsulfatase A-like enzyme